VSGGVDVVWIVALGGCSTMYKFEIHSPEIPLSEDDMVVYRILEGAGEGGAGTLEGMLSCEAEGAVCRSTGYEGTDEITDGSEILVWLDVAGDDFEEWKAADLALEDLAPDPEDAAGGTTWNVGFGVHTIVVQLERPEVVSSP
jgi:hypothetical protein